MTKSEKVRLAFNQLREVYREIGQGESADRLIERMQALIRAEMEPRTEEKDKPPATDIAEADIAASPEAIAFCKLAFTSSPSFKEKAAALDALFAAKLGEKVGLETNLAEEQREHMATRRMLAAEAESNAESKLSARGEGLTESEKGRLAIIKSDTPNEDKSTLWFGSTIHWLISIIDRLSSRPAANLDDDEIKRIAEQEWDSYPEEACPREVMLKCVRVVMSRLAPRVSPPAQAEAAGDVEARIQAAVNDIDADGLLDGDWDRNDSDAKNAERRRKSKEEVATFLRRHFSAIAPPDARHNEKTGAWEWKEQGK